MVKAKIFIYAARCDGLPKTTDFQLVEETLPELNHGGYFFFFRSIASLFCIRRRIEKQLKVQSKCKKSLNRNEWTNFTFYLKY